VLGRALASYVLSRLLERMRVCPPRRSASLSRARNKGLLVVEVDCSRLAMEQLVQERQLVCSTASSSRSPTTRTVNIGSYAELTLACAMSPTVVQMASNRLFERKTGQHVKRLMLEQYRHVDGRVFFVRGRRPAHDEVDVAARETEGWDKRNKRYVSPLVLTAVKFDDLPGLPKSFPSCFIVEGESYERRGWGL